MRRCVLVLAVDVLLAEVLSVAPASAVDYPFNVFEQVFAHVTDG